MNGFELEIEFLGTGTSSGIPEIGCSCPVCISQDACDKRMRTSAVVRYQGKNLLIDCGPDFRSQMLRSSSTRLDALLVTHIHYDHVGGMDDLRAYCHEGTFPVYARPDVIDDLHKHMPYCFADKLYPGVPLLELHEIGETPFVAAGVEVVPIPVMHGSRPIVGFKIGPLAYITDAKTIDDSVIDSLLGIKLLVINALRIAPHHSHLELDKSLEIVTRINPEKAFFIHMSHGMGLHKEMNKKLPDNVRLAHDGLIVRV